MRATDIAAGQDCIRTTDNMTSRDTSTTWTRTTAASRIAAACLAQKVFLTGDIPPPGEANNVRTVFLSDQYRISHQWTPRASTPAARPAGNRAPSGSWQLGHS